MAVNYTAVAWTPVVMLGIAIVLGVYVLARLALDLSIRRGLVNSKKHQDDIESDAPSHNRFRITATRSVALAGVICSLLSNILELVIMFDYVDYYDLSHLKRYTALNFFSIAGVLCLFVTAILTTKALASPSKGHSISRIVYTILLVLIALFALIVFILQTVINSIRYYGSRGTNYFSLARATAIIGHTYFGLLGLTTLVISIGLIRRWTQIRGAEVPTAERSALKMFTIAAVPVLTAIIVLGIVYRATFMGGLYSYYSLNALHGYLAYHFISLIFNLWGNILVFEFARKAVKKLSMI
ncbi:hypothetical protein QC762_115590 [Podospora pseudocomata]|uniref:Uncharacterized protein n=1 Tax=Podospora pseudocomata TaxID=2093779 RepID=A0ABR0GWE7_9PEZI|nr:hypothetical protein QC762_115590 [Podospora pseudocomata]